MADWKQITARIRRAQGSRDPAGQLALLFEKTADAMVAFELGRHFEVARDTAQALQWYQTAAAKFRRGDWKTKATEAVLRLGGELPQESVDSSLKAAPELPLPVLPRPESALFQPVAGEPEPVLAVGAENPPSDPSLPAASSDRKRRRRGRRGGRNRRKAAATAPSPQVESSAHRSSTATRDIGREFEDIAPPRVVDSRSIPRLPVEPLPDSSAPGVKGRFGDPGLSSRLTLLEMQLRRLLTCPPAKLDHAEHAPVGPGVFVLTDEDMTTYYYVESCDTLRIAIGNLSRSGATRRGNPNLKPLLADLLGISEARVTKYLADHCVVRWLQLDEGAPPFAHFAIAVLRPTLNE